MNTSKTFSNEDAKTIISVSVAGAAMGLLYSYGFEFGTLVGLLGGAAFGAMIGVRITRRPPKMRYPMVLFRRILFSATFTLLASFGYSYLLDQNLSQSQQFWVVLLPLAGWAALVISLGMAIASLDELQRRIQIEAIAIGFAGTAIFVGGYALFQFAGVADINVGVVLLAMSLFWLLGKLLTLWKYR